MGKHVFFILSLEYKAEIGILGHLYYRLSFLIKHKLSKRKKYSRLKMADLKVRH